MKAKRFTRQTLTHSWPRATCSTCYGEGGWEWQSANAQAVAARHTDATGHETRVEIELTVIYRATVNEVSA